MGDSSQGCCRKEEGGINRFRLTELGEDQRGAETFLLVLLCRRMGFTGAPNTFASPVPPHLSPWRW